MHKIKDRERTQIINGLRAGIVPPVGLRHIQVGRNLEIEQIVKDITHISDNGSTVRFIAGEFGAGKSFFLMLTKLIALEKKLVVVQADISTERILCASDGKARALLTELLKNMSLKSRPNGEALNVVIETWIGNFQEKNPNPTENDFLKELSPLSHFQIYSDFAKVLFRYLDAYKSNDIAIMNMCMKWFRAEYANKTEAKKDLGVTRIIDDSDFYDALKLYSGFVRLAGFSGLLVAIDELAVLVRQRAPQRNKNYETILSILNDCLGGKVEGLGFIFGATTESVQNKDKGLYSYGALETRLASSNFGVSGLKDLSGTVMPLATLSREEIRHLLDVLRDIYENYEVTKRLLPDEGVEAFFQHVYSKMGADEHLNPRDVIKEYLQLLATLENNPNIKWTDLIKNIAIEKSREIVEEDLVDL